MGPGLFIPPMGAPPPPMLLPRNASATEKYLSENYFIDQELEQVNTTQFNTFKRFCINLVRKTDLSKFVPKL